MWLWINKNVHVQLSYNVVFRIVVPTFAFSCRSVFVWSDISFIVINIKNVAPIKLSIISDWCRNVQPILGGIEG